jgi:hypothetical protein
MGSCSFLKFKKLKIKTKDLTICCLQNNSSIHRKAKIYKKCQRRTLHNEEGVNSEEYKRINVCATNNRASKHMKPKPREASK